MQIAFVRTSNSLLPSLLSSAPLPPPRHLLVDFLRSESSHLSRFQPRFLSVSPSRGHSLLPLHSSSPRFLSDSPSPSSSPFAIILSLRSSVPRYIHRHPFLSLLSPSRAVDLARARASVKNVSTIVPRDCRGLPPVVIPLFPRPKRSAREMAIAIAKTPNTSGRMGDYSKDLNYIDIIYASSTKS
ncbi:hypothetical protein PUN28_018605 [Cardiocondyla obscurior]|uniref:Uncharacterized protein n=1 Tax=Cardiocondyla obscurior TaxID=286306 RepID=A0AAW2EIU9_9HYME